MVGIDPGSFTSVAANFTTQGIDIILSDSSATYTPSFLGFTP